MDNTKKQNMALSLLAAFGLALVGGIVYGLLYYIGYVAYLGSYLIFILAGVGYKKVSKKTALEIKDYVILSVISILVTIISLMATKIIFIIVEYGISFENSFNTLIQLIASGELTQTLVWDIVWGVGFVIAGAVSMYFTEKRKAKQQAEKQAQPTVVNPEQPTQETAVNPEQPTSETIVKPNEDTVTEPTQDTAPAQPKKCKYCGNINNANDKFCNGCGKRLS